MSNSFIWPYLVVILRVWVDWSHNIRLCSVINRTFIEGKGSYPSVEIQYSIVPAYWACLIRGFRRNKFELHIRFYIHLFVCYTPFGISAFPLFSHISLKKNFYIQHIHICPWCNGHRRRKWTRRHEFKSWTRLIAFHIALIHFGKVWIQLFSLQLWVNSRAD